MKLYRGFPVLMFVLVLFMLPAHAATITTTAQGGLWGDKTTWIGGVVPTVNDDVIVTSTVKGGNSFYTSTTFNVGSLTIQSGGKIIREVAEAGGIMFDVHGKFVNHGEVIDYKGFLDFKFRSDMENHGMFKPRIVYMEGTGQRISGTAPISASTFNLNMKDEELLAASNLAFHNCRITSSVSSTTKKLNMGGFSLTISASDITGTATVGSIGSIGNPVIFSNTGKLIIDKAKVGGTIFGNVLLQSPSIAILTNLIIEGSLVIDEGTWVSGDGNNVNVRVRGPFTNYGRMNKDTIVTSTSRIAPKTMYLYATGNVINRGVTGLTRVLQVTNGKTVSLKGEFDGDVYLEQAENTTTPGGKVVISDEVIIHNVMQVNANLEVTAGGQLTLLRKQSSTFNVSSYYGTVTNEGVISRYHHMSNAWSNRAFTNQPGMHINFEIREWSGRIEGLDVTSYNNQTYTGLPGSTKRWWRIKPVGDGVVTGYTLKLFYDETLLNGQKEENLKVYRSVDEGETWEVISLGEFTILNTEENSITIGRWDRPASLLNAFGDFVISAGDGSVPVASPVVVDLVGRDDIRLGAPNPFTIHLHNVTDYKTGAFFAAITVTEDIHFKQVEVPGFNGKEIIPIDSIGKKDDHTQVFFVPYLNPNETYSFDVIVVGVNAGGKGQKAGPPTLTATCLGMSAAKDKAEDMVVDQIIEFVDLDEQETREFYNALRVTVKQQEMLKEKEGTGVWAFRTMTKSAVEQASKSNPLTNIAFKIGNTIELVSKVKDSFRRRIFHWFYKEVGLYGVEEIKVMDGKQKEGSMTNSWDPNEKAGPTGFGNLNHKSEAGLMHYTIYFENLKEATAPAYRVQITDTLAGVIDPETVKFGASSHEGTDYNWVMERNGNILKWDIEGIELPPNVTPPEGEGYVSFSVSLKDGLPSGTSIENKATIIFDINPPITTNTWINVLDMESPVTTMLPIAYEVGDTLITVSCNSVDNPNGSGVEMYWFYVSENNGPFRLIGETFENSISYAVPDNANNNYRFYAIAIDHVGNMEQHVPAYAVVNSLAVSVNELADFSHAIQVFPNPSSGTFTVGLDLKESAHLRYDVYTVAGQLIGSVMEGPVDAGHHSFAVDLSAYKQGVYIARIYINGEATSVRLMKR